MPDLSIANILFPVAAVLIDPANGQPYRYGSADVSTGFNTANPTSPWAVMPISPTTTLPYR